MTAANARIAIEIAEGRADAVDRAHRHAMAAKECTFTAQDEVSRAWASQSPNRRRAALLRKLERRLAKVRTELEQLDNDYLAFKAGAR